MARKTKQPTFAISKEALCEAVMNTYEDSRFYVGRGVAEGCDFTEGSSCYRSDFVTKAELLTEIREHAFPLINSMPDAPDYLVLNKNTFLSASCVSDNQIFHTEAPEGYAYLSHHVNQHYGIYYQIDKENNTITVMIGDKKKTYLLVRNYEFTFKLSRNKLLCADGDDLERFFSSDIWTRNVIKAFRKSLGLEVCKQLKDAIQKSA